MGAWNIIRWKSVKSTKSVYTRDRFSPLSSAELCADNSSPSTTANDHTQRRVTKRRCNLRNNIYRDYRGKKWTRGVRKWHYWSFDERFLRFCTNKIEQREKRGYKKRHKTWVFTHENGRFWTWEVQISTVVQIQSRESKRVGASGCKVEELSMELETEN